ncbi:Sensory box histidine kinase [Chitinispirillum alkaliphilum]|nr:Sensory box histidine kinase [Chitinispirillum alkaliphilum]
MNMHSDDLYNQRFKRAEDARVLAEGIVETMPTPLVILDSDLRIIRVNRAFYKTFRETKETTIGIPLYRVGKGQWDIPRLRNLLQTILSHNRVIEDYEVEHFFHGLGERTVLLNAREVKLEEGADKLILLAFEDVTAQKRSRNVLEESEKLFHDLVERLNSIIISTDEKGRITFLNTFCEKIFGYTKDELVGKPLLGTIIPCRNDCDQLWQSMLSQPHLYYLNETRSKRKDGSEVLFSWSFKAVYDEYNQIRELLIDGNDLSSQIRQKKQLQDAFELIDNSPDIIAMFKSDGHCMYINRAVELLTGFTRDDICGAMIHNTAIDHLFGKWFKTSTHKKEVQIEETFYMGNWFQIISVPQKDEKGNIRSAMMYARDITELKNTEAQLLAAKKEAEEKTRELRRANSLLTEKNNELDSFNYSISHDLRTPVSSIIGFSELLIEDYSREFDQEGLKFLHFIRKNAHTMSRLINDLLSLSRITREEITVEKVNLSELAWKVADELKDRDPNRKVDIKIQSNMTVNADRRFMDLVLTNLLGNAWKYSQKEEHAEIEFGKTEEEGQEIFFVNDNGAGFDNSQSQQLFQPFKRLHSEKEYSGTGVGLAIVERVIKKHNGTVWARAEKGKGAQFFFTLGT